MYFTKEIQVLIDQNKTSQAADELIKVLRNGKREVLDKAKGVIQKISPVQTSATTRRSSSKRKAPTTNTHLKKFLHQLEKEDLPMVTFLSHIDLARQKHESGEWQAAKQNYELANEIHQDSFSMSKSEIEEKIASCSEAINFFQYVEQGNGYFLQREWENAFISFGQAKALLKEEYGIHPPQLNHAISMCERGMHFQKLTHMANIFKSRKQWVEAGSCYQKALNIYQDDFHPSRPFLECQMIYCQNKKESFQVFGNRLFFSMKSEHISIFLVIAIIALLSFAFMFDQFSEPLIPSSPSSPAPLPPTVQTETVQSIQEFLPMEGEELSEADSSQERLVSEVEVAEDLPFFLPATFPENTVNRRVPYCSFTGRNQASHQTKKPTKETLQNRTSPFFSGTAPCEQGRRTGICGRKNCSHSILP